MAQKIMAQKMTWLLLPRETFISPKCFLHFLCNLLGSNQ